MSTQEQTNFVPVRKNQKLVQPPIFQFDQFQISLVTEQNYDEAFNCFCLGYQLNHPFFKALGATLEDIKLIFQQKYRMAFEQRPLQQYVVYDTTKNQKIVGTFLTQHFMQMPEIEAELQKLQEIKNKQNLICKMKNEFDNRMAKKEIIQPFVDEIITSQNPMIYQQISISILPEYMQYGFFFKMLVINFYTSAKLGVKGYIDLIFNKVTGHVSMKHCQGKLLNDLDIRNETYKGEHIFKDDMCRGQLIHTDLYNSVGKKAIANDEAFGGFHNQAVAFVNQQREIKKAAQRIQNKQQSMLQQPRL